MDFEKGLQEPQEVWMFCLKPSHLFSIWRRKLTRFVKIEGICTLCGPYVYTLHLWRIGARQDFHYLWRFSVLLLAALRVELNKRPQDEGDQAIGLVVLFHLLALIYMSLSLSPPLTDVWILRIAKEGRWTGGCATRKTLPQKPRPVPFSVPTSVSCLSGEHGANAHR